MRVEAFESKYLQCLVSSYDGKAHFRRRICKRESFGSAGFCCRLSRPPLPFPSLPHPGVLKLLSICLPRAGHEGVWPLFARVMPCHVFGFLFTMVCSYEKSLAVIKRVGRDGEYRTARPVIARLVLAVFVALTAVYREKKRLEQKLNQVVDVTSSAGGILCFFGKSGFSLNGGGCYACLMKKGFDEGNLSCLCAFRCNSYIIRATDLVV